MRKALVFSFFFPLGASAVSLTDLRNLALKPLIEFQTNCTTIFTALRYYPSTRSFYNTANREQALAKMTSGQKLYVLYAIESSLLKLLEQGGTDHFANVENLLGHPSYVPRGLIRRSPFDLIWIPKVVRSLPEEAWRDPKQAAQIHFAFHCLIFASGLSEPHNQKIHLSQIRPEALSGLAEFLQLPPFSHDLENALVQSLLGEAAQLVPFASDLAGGQLDHLPPVPQVLEVRKAAIKLLPTLVLSTRKWSDTNNVLLKSQLKLVLLTLRSLIVGDSPVEALLQPAREAIEALGFDVESFTSGKTAL